MQAAKIIQRFYKPSQLPKLRVVKKLNVFESDQGVFGSAANDTNVNLSRNQVIELYDWISEINEESNGS